MRSRSRPRCRPELNALASALDFTGKRNKVVISDFEFPTNAQIWHAQEPRGAKVVHVATPTPPATSRRRNSRTPSTRTQSSSLLRTSGFRNGAKLEIPEIVRIARAKGAMVLLDCYQAVARWTSMSKSSTSTSPWAAC